MEYCSVMKCNEALKYTMMWTNVKKKHYVKGKKLVTQNHMLCDCIYMKCSEKAIHRDRQQISGSPNAGALACWGKRGVTANEYRIYFRGDENALKS